MLDRSSMGRNKALEFEIKKEQAAALGRAGRQVQEALEALRMAPRTDEAAQAKHLGRATHAVWRYFVQREACGITNHDPAIEEYAIPQRVLARVGARES
jgi:hypothetical protein